LSGDKLFQGTLEMGGTLFNGFFLGLSDMAILDANRLTLGTSLKAVSTAREQFNKQFPILVRWQMATARKAHTEQVLVNRYGELKRFYEVFAPNGKGGLNPGSQFSEAVRFLPESEAVGWMQGVLGRLGGEIDDLRVFGRDMLVFEVEESRVERHLEDIRRIMDNDPIVSIKAQHDYQAELEIQGKQ